MPNRRGLQRDIVARFLVSMTLVGLIGATAVICCYLNDRHLAEGPLVIRLSFKHGVHVFDLVVLAIEMVLVSLLSVALLVGFSRRR